MLNRSWIIVAGLITFLAGAQPASAELWYSTEALFWDRTGGSDTNYITGPNTVSGNVANPGIQPGYRFIVGGSFMDYEAEAQFSRIDNWGDTATGLLTAGVVFDDSLIAANRVNTKSALFDAATRDIVDPEVQFLQAGARFRAVSESSLEDYQFNIGTSRDVSWFRWGIGYRHLNLSEATSYRMGGVFNSLDVDDGAGPGLPGNLGDDGLSHANITAAGFGLISGAADGYNSIDTLAVPPTTDIVDVLFNGTARNRLDGVQVSMAARHQVKENIYLEAFARFGLYRNQVTGRVTEALIGSGPNDNSIYARTLNDSRNKASFVTNLGVNAFLDLTDYISITTGYEVLFIDGVAVGPDQMQGVSRTPFGATTYSVEANNLVIVHGTKVGLEIRW